MFNTCIPLWVLLLKTKRLDFSIEHDFVFLMWKVFQQHDDVAENDDSSCGPGHKLLLMGEKAFIQ
jgi:hypothetical protein